MNRGLYIGASSLITNQRRMEVLSNNLSNVNTAGYKKDYSISESFPEKLLASKSRIGQVRRQDQPLEIQLDTYEDGDRNIYRARTNKGYFRVLVNGSISHEKEIKFIGTEDGYFKTGYRDLSGQFKTEGGNYLLDNQGRRLQNTAAANLEINEESLRGLIYHPQAYVIGSLSGGVKFKKIHTDFSQGGLVDTGNPWDLALNGPGFFKLEGQVDGQARTYYTRDGNFLVAREENLAGSNEEICFIRDLNGNSLMAKSEDASYPLAIKASQLKRGDINIGSDGSLSIGGEAIEAVEGIHPGLIGLDIVKLDNGEFLRKLGSNNYSMAQEEVYDQAGNLGLREIEPEEDLDFRPTVYQGYLESSNTNAIDSMTEMITLLREFEANQKAIKMQDEMLEKAATEIGRV